MHRRAVQAEYELLSIYDPALDADASNVSAYQDTLDPRHLKHVAEPVRYTVRCLTIADEQLYYVFCGETSPSVTLEELRSDPGKLLDTLQARMKQDLLLVSISLVAVAGVTIVQPDGSETPLQIVRATDGRVELSTLEQLGGLVVRELAQYIRQLSTPFLPGESSASRQSPSTSTG